MDESIQQFGETLGRRILAKDWSAVHELLAPWLRAKMSAADVRAFFEDEYRKALEENGVEGMHYPEYPEPDIGGNNFMTAEQLRQPVGSWSTRVRDVAPELTQDRLRYWMRVALMCSDDQMAAFGFDMFAELWVAVVELDEGLRVGYWSHGAY